VEDRFSLAGQNVQPNNQRPPAQNPQQRPQKKPAQNPQQRPPSQKPPAQNPQIQTEYPQQPSDVNQFQNDNSVCGVPVIGSQSLGKSNVILTN
jgi:outer membrane biosynthesis protein TonB